MWWCMVQLLLNARQQASTRGGTLLCSEPLNQAGVHETKSVLIKKMGEGPESKYHGMVWLSSIWLDSFTSQKMSILTYGL